ncbi:MAG TPA: hypothetical protein VHR43_11910 [Gemmatimonadales bacterium]|nr:hypothetical protein [Gemmatimonadales bacterium]
MSRPDLLKALDEAIAAVRRLETPGLRTSTGAPATGELAQLRTDLGLRREEVAAGGELDHDWARRTVRSVAGWLPDAELPLLARLGAVVRAADS